MDIRGIWKVKEVRVPTPDGEKVFTPDNPPTDERFEGSAELMKYRTEFAEDGVLNTLMFVPEEMREEAAKHGAVVREDGYAPSKAPHGKKRTANSITTRRSRVKSSGKRSIHLRRFPSPKTDACCTATE